MSRQFSLSPDSSPASPPPSHSQSSCSFPPSWDSIRKELFPDFYDSLAEVDINRQLCQINSSTKTTQQSARDDTCATMGILSAAAGVESQAQLGKNVDAVNNDIMSIDSTKTSDDSGNECFLVSGDSIVSGAANLAEQVEADIMSAKNASIGFTLDTTVAMSPEATMGPFCALVPKWFAKPKHEKTLAKYKKVENFYNKNIHAPSEPPFQDQHPIIVVEKCMHFFGHTEKGQKYATSTIIKHLTDLFAMVKVKTKRDIIGEERFGRLGMMISNQRDGAHVDLIRRNIVKDMEQGALTDLSHYF
jgi:hypothetical protein